MTSAHLGAVVNIQAEAFSENLRETPSVFADRLSRFGQHFRVGLVEGQVAAYLICFPWKIGETPVNNQKFPATLPEPDCFFIHDIAVIPEARGTGLARALLENAYRQADALGLDAVSLVAVGQSGSYWDKAGFVPYKSIGSEKFAHVLEIYGPGARLMARPV